LLTTVGYLVNEAGRQGVPIHLSDAFEAACGRHCDVGFEDLSEIDRILVSIWALEADVNNGGFHQYYFNSSGDTAHYAPAALRAIGAPIMACIVDKANPCSGQADHLSLAASANRRYAD